MILARILGRVPNVVLVNPIAADLVRPGLLNFPTQKEINAQHSIFPYQQQTGSFGIQQQGPIDPINTQLPFPQAPQAQNYFAGLPQQQYIQGQNPFPQINYQGQFTPTVPTQLQKQQQYQQQFQQLFQIQNPQLDQQQHQAQQKIELYQPVQLALHNLHQLIKSYVFQVLRLILPHIQIQTLVSRQPPAQLANPAQIIQKGQILIRRAIWTIANTIQRGTNLESTQSQKNNKQLDVSWEWSPPSPNVDIQISARSKEQFPRMEEQMSGELEQQHITTWNQEGYDLVDQKSRHSDPPPAGYAEDNAHIRPFIYAHNRRHRFSINEYKAFRKENNFIFFMRKSLQSDIRKDFPRSQGRHYENDIYV
ncbi:MAG: hypothetical protein EZS28_037839 [Streblomastix strix]|uniref:Uncharacterized protein n=1 Tax=Streblomastix strix TaxID=222440 RepID=A0A5J4U8X6_9EUKA|nr:MAG: hypothetical protein EZS28_037839 [Streblomastix strix]